MQGLRGHIENFWFFILRALASNVKFFGGRGGRKVVVMIRFAFCTELNNQSREWIGRFKESSQAIAVVY